MRLPLSRPSRWAVPVVATILVAGCGPNDGVRSYSVPKTPEPKPNPPAVVDAAPDAKDGAEYRILGGMFPADDPVWFFKLTGKASAVADHEAEVDQLLASVRLPAGGKDVPTWELPPGWKSGGKESIHADTLLFGPADKPLKLTVTPAMGGVSGNVQRWAGQVGAPADDTSKYTRPIETKTGTKGLRVDVTGPKNPVGGPMMGKR